MTDILSESCNKFSFVIKIEDDENEKLVVKNKF